MASSEFKKYAEKEKWIHFADEMVSLLQSPNEKALLKVLKEGFDVLEDIQKLQSQICFNADLINRTASKGWYQSLKILLDNDCYINKTIESKNDGWDALMWVLACSIDHPKSVRTVVEHMLNQIYMVDEYVAYEICSNHPQIWPGVSDLFPKNIQEQALGWALKGQSDYPEGNYEVILLSKLEHDLKQISKKDTVLKTKYYKEDIEGQYSRFKNCDLFDIARWAVMGNLSEVFNMVEHIINKDNPKEQRWVIDLSHNSKAAQSAVNWYKWKRCKVQLAYLYNTEISHKLFADMIDPKVVVYNSSLYVEMGVALWQKSRDWNVIERLRQKAPKIAHDILNAIPINEMVENPEGAFQHPYICDILHDRGVGLTKNTSFFSEIFKKCSTQYQEEFLLPQPTSEVSSSDVFLKNLQERQHRVSQNLGKQKQGFFDSIMADFANPTPKKKL